MYTGGLYDEHTVNQQLPFQIWGRGSYEGGGGGLYAGIYGTHKKLKRSNTFKNFKVFH